MAASAANDTRDLDVYNSNYTDESLPEPLGARRALNRVFYYAAKAGKLEEMRNALSAGANINCVGESVQCTALHVAAMSGHVACVNDLLEKGINIHTVTSAGNSALDWAADRNQGEVVEILVKRVGRENVDLKGFTALLFAARSNATVSMQALLAAPFTNINHAALSGETAMHFAAVYGHACVPILLAHGAISLRQTKDLFTPVHMCLVAKPSDASLQALRLLANSPAFGPNDLLPAHPVVADPRQQRGVPEPPLVMAVKKKLPAYVEELLKAGADTSRSGGGEPKLPLMVALDNKDEAALLMLIQYGANPADEATIVRLPNYERGTRTMNVYHYAGMVKESAMLEAALLKVCTWKPSLNQHTLHSLRPVVRAIMTLYLRPQGADTNGWPSLPFELLELVFNVITGDWSAQAVAACREARALEDIRAEAAKAR